MTTTFPEGRVQHPRHRGKHDRGAVRRGQSAARQRLRDGRVLDAQIAERAKRGTANEIAYFMTHPLMSTQNRPLRARRIADGRAHREGPAPVRRIRGPERLAHQGAQRLSRVRLLATPRSGHDRAPGERARDRAEGGDSLAKGDRRRAPTTTRASTPATPGHEFLSPERAPRRATWCGRSAARDGAVRSARRAASRSRTRSSSCSMTEARRKVTRTRTKKTLSVSGPISGLFRMVFDEDRVSMPERVIFRGKASFTATCRAPPPAARGRRAVRGHLRVRGVRLLADLAFREGAGGTAKTDDRIFLVVGTLLNRIFARYVTEPRSARRELNIVYFVKQLVALVASNCSSSLPVPRCRSSAELRLPHRARRAQELRPGGAAEGGPRHGHVLRDQRRRRDHQAHDPRVECRRDWTSPSSPASPRRSSARTPRARRSPSSSSRAAAASSPRRQPRLPRVRGLQMRLPPFLDCSEVPAGVGVHQDADQHTRHHRRGRPPRGQGAADGDRRDLPHERPRVRRELHQGPRASRRSRGST